MGGKLLLMLNGYIFSLIAIYALIQEAKDRTFSKTVFYYTV